MGWKWIFGHFWIKIGSPSVFDMFTVLQLLGIESDALYTGIRVWKNSMLKLCEWIGGTKTKCHESSEWVRLRLEIKQNYCSILKKVVICYQLRPDVQMYASIPAALLLAVYLGFWLYVWTSPLNWYKIWLNCGILKWFCLISNLSQTHFDGIWHAKNTCPACSL